jgi:hypothetical protein
MELIAMDNNLQALSTAVQHNCDIADALHARNFTLCTYLLKMRELYRWEKGYPFQASLPKDELGEWMTRREQRWEVLEDQSFAPIPIGGAEFNPFDTDAINRTLLPDGLVYSGGVGGRSTPHFFLADLLSAEQRDGFPVLVAGNEHARDLAAPPAMMLGGTVFVRRESLRRMLWEKIEEWNWKKKGNAMARSLGHYDFEQDFTTALERMTDTETEAVILHELGECRAGAQLGPDWSDMLAALSGSRAEIVARAVRDHVADCSVALPRLLEHHNTASLHFYFANFTGMRRATFPELNEAYRRWADGGQLAALGKEVETGKDRWTAIARKMLDSHRQAPDSCANRIIELAPISCGA